MRSYPGFYTPQILSPRTIWRSYRNMQGQIEGESNAPRSIAEAARLCSRASTYRHEGCSGDFRLPQICVCMHCNHPKYNKDTHLRIRQEDGRFGLCSWLYANCSGCKVLHQRLCEVWLAAVYRAFDLFLAKGEDRTVATCRFSQSLLCSTCFEFSPTTYSLFSERLHWKI
jgi:hypothetical protein